VRLLTLSVLATLGFATAAQAQVVTEVSRLLPVCVTALAQGFEQADTLVAQGYTLRRADSLRRDYHVQFESVGGFPMATIERSADLSLSELSRRGILQCTITIESEETVESVDQPQLFADLVRSGFADLGFQSDGSGGLVRDGLRIEAQLGIGGKRRNPEMKLFLTARR
jgi:hypothetical protein